MFFWNSRPDDMEYIVEPLDFRFQSLFFWNSRPDGDKIDITLIHIKFQSLFFWNSRPDVRMATFFDPEF